MEWHAKKASTLILFFFKFRQRPEDAHLQIIRLSWRFQSRSIYSERRKRWATCDKEKEELIHPVNHSLKKQVIYHTYRLAEKSKKYDQSVSKYIAKEAMHMNTQMKPHTFHLFDAISIIKFLKNFKLASVTNGVYKSWSVWLFNSFMAINSFTTLNKHLSPKCVVQNSGQCPNCHTSLDRGPTDYWSRVIA